MILELTLKGREEIGPIGPIRPIGPIQFPSLQIERPDQERGHLIARHHVIRTVLRRRTTKRDSPLEHLLDVRVARAARRNVGEALRRGRRRIELPERPDDPYRHLLARYRSVRTEVPRRAC